MLWRSKLCIVSGGLAVLFFGNAEAGASNIVMSRPTIGSGPVIEKVHSVEAAEQTLYRRGYYDVRIERTDLPYSFSACKRGTRYHIHVDYYGDLVQVDPIGRCNGNDYDSNDDDRRRYYGRHRYREGY